MAKRTIVVTGGAGQVGHELIQQPWPEDVTVLAPSREELDLADAASIKTWFAGRKIDCIINTAAYTAVDLAESNAGITFLVNAQGPAWLADVAQTRNIPLLHVSTDYVFDGSLDRPYVEDDPVAPLGVYGASKLAGEFAVRTGAARHVILRTAWVISAHRSNFLKTMLRLAAEQPELRVVADQHGCPTGAQDIASALRTIALAHLADASAPCGTYHFVNTGSTTWHGLAEAIVAASVQHGGPSVRVVAIGTDDFPTRARRPMNSRLATDRIEQDFGIVAQSWQSMVAAIVAALAPAQTRNTV